MQLLCKMNTILVQTIGLLDVSFLPNVIKIFRANNANATELF